MSSVMLILLPFNIPPFLMRELRSAYDIQLSDSSGRSLQSKLLIYVCGKKGIFHAIPPDNVLEVIKSKDHKKLT